LTFNITYKSSVQRDLKKLSTDVARRVLDDLEYEVSRHAHAQPLLQGAFAGLRKLRVGAYRVIYVLHDDTVLVLRIGHRKGVYK
jgi:mRNA interferase RelE/StbE